MDEKELLEKLNTGFDEMSKMEESDVLSDFHYDIFDRMKQNAQEKEAQDSKKDSDELIPVVGRYKGNAKEVSYLDLSLVGGRAVFGDAEHFLLLFADGDDHDTAFFELCH